MPATVEADHLAADGDLDPRVDHVGAHPVAAGAHARHHDLERPLFYTLHFAARLLRTPVPDDIGLALARPPAAVVRSMDWLVSRALLPITDVKGSRGEEAARTVLYARSLWLRMPPHLLAAHLFRKAARRWTGGNEA